MNRVRTKFDPPSGLTGSPNTSKPNRLRRSFRQTQRTQAAAEVDSPKSQQFVFKTPTRIPRSRAGAGFSGESPHNDSDFQQDIIWDATSPSPNRLGKRGKKQPAGVVDISEIVSRIAPKHGRPKVAEPTLQQWIGDSATIPCTPDVQVPKPKKKSPRPNGVDDLLKLAKQFDFNMFHQDEEEEEVEDPHQQSPELLSEDILDLENGDQNFSAPHPETCQPDVTAAAGPDEQVRLGQHMEDDLDFLFDGPTQHVSGNLSQVSSAQPSQEKPAFKEASGKPSASSRPPTSVVSATNVKGASGNDEFEDDWENDDLLNDSLVLAMTQNPLNFIAPQHCSTQKPSGPGNAPARAGAGHDQSAVSKVEKDNVRQRTTFKLEPNPNFSVTRIQTDAWTNWKVDHSSKAAKEDAQQSRCKGSVVAAGSQRTWQTSNTAKSDPQKPEFHQRTSAESSSFKHNTADTRTAQSFPQKPEAGSSNGEALAVSDLLDEDLDAFFSADPVWDDPADDDLLCEICEDVENQIQSAVSAKQTVPVSNQRPALQPSSRTGGDNRTQQPANRQPFSQKQTPATLLCAPGRSAGASLAAGFVSNVAAAAQTNTVTNSFRFTQAKSSQGPTNSSGRLQGDSRVQPGPQGDLRKDQFTFKKPGNPVSAIAMTNKVPGKCSAAEIELKKQQAMEKRRQRLQAAQNLRAPT